jgi:hypothetical protein
MVTVPADTPGVLPPPRPVNVKTAPAGMSYAPAFHVYHGFAPRADQSFAQIFMLVLAGIADVTNNAHTPEFGTYGLNANGTIWHGSSLMFNASSAASTAIS